MKLRCLDAVRWGDEGYGLLGEGACEWVCTSFKERAVVAFDCSCGLAGVRRPMKELDVCIFAGRGGSGGGVDSLDISCCSVPLPEFESLSMVIVGLESVSMLEGSSPATPASAVVVPGGLAVRVPFDAGIWTESPVLFVIESLSPYQ